MTLGFPWDDSICSIASQRYIIATPYYCKIHCIIAMHSELLHATSGGPVSAAWRATTAVAGGTTVALGDVLTPLPTPGGLLLIYCGMSVLGAESTATRRALDAMKGQVLQRIGDAYMEGVGNDGAGGDIIHVRSLLEEVK